MDDFHILAFETSSTLCGVALLSHADGRTRLSTAAHEGRGEHAERILPMAQGLLDQAGLARRDLSAIAFGQGPGGFTGLRVACGVAQGLAVALDIPVLPVDSLCAVALQGAGEDPAGVHVVLQDARMNEVYAAAYRASGVDWATLQAPALLARADVAAWAACESAGWGMRAGGGWTMHGDALDVFPGLARELESLGAQRAPTTSDGAHAQAGTIARLAAQAWREGRAVDAALASPAYVRDKVAYTTVERAGGLGGNPLVDAATLTLHDMTATDVDEAAAIEGRVQSFPWTRKNFADGLAAGYRGWVVRRMGAMLGFALVMDAPDMAHLLVIGVRPDAQRQGVGTRLLRRCIDHCRQSGLPALTLEVRPSNERAIAFYRRHGFEQAGLRRGYYPAARGREDAWIMTLNLAADAA
ncbi:bifunctional tRNA (adenosine(37)-N6)-threonylcarbamoyltransferase complex dimerization subunit type 1 TsaB/ribosomal protein alanine acetyltransferase RimI [Castellaniella daejeonensis]|jgi:tRNA threonylcarbamoyladenosine biosynthesis protein TsaB|uniref:[Ribosomal protein bS18]-alanine N-acetyltransferase n=1 Tax=Castellaniella daejeonensis TaxID=659013 RepID=A0ABN0U136_9BURK|nr:tRNA (adenosine(37)-N6)-threonylcarbamoyltransferase complex dimerization subunit type 1 TsaB [Castellaniella sp.]HET8704456.1 tRNA (adenosine(37)-N6)-threonylcarbamoyltransferase complex dimerization subunit type 1 TsaB [Castellaniella sp.]